MAATATGHDRIQVLHSGAHVLGGPQPVAARSLGGLRSSTRAVVFDAMRPSALPNMTVVWASAYAQAGIGRIDSDGQGRLRFAAPGEEYGAWQDVAIDTDAVLPSETESRYVIVRRSGIVPAASEAVQLCNVFQNAAACGDFTEAQSTAGANKYRCVFIHNAGTTTASSVLVTVVTGWSDVHVAAETPDGDGAVQEIANEDTAPTGLTFSQPESGTELDVGPLAAGASVGLWIRSTVAAASAASARTQNAVLVSAIYGAQQADSGASGLFRVAAANTARYELRIGAGVQPTAEDTPDATSSTLPIEYNVALPTGTHYIDVRRRNRFGLLSANLEPRIIEVDGSGNVLPVRPAAPQAVGVTGNASDVAVQARYYPAADDAGTRATHWAIWVTTDGTAPDPSDTPTDTVAMRSATGQQPEYLFWESDPILDGTPVQVLVRTRRTDGDGDTDSANTAPATATVDAGAPRRPSGRLLLGGRYGHALPGSTAPDTTVVVDGDAEVEWRVESGSTALYAGEDLIWRAIYRGAGHPDNGLYVPDALDIETGAVSGAAAGEIAIDVDATWPTARRLWVAVRGQRRLLVDLDAGAITVAAIEAVVLDATQSASSAPAWPRYGETCLQVWDPEREDYATVAEVQYDGDLRMAVPLVHGMTQTAIEAM